MRNEAERNDAANLTLPTHSPRYTLSPTVRPPHAHPTVSTPRRTRKVTASIHVPSNKNNTGANSSARIQQRFTPPLPPTFNQPPPQHIRHKQAAAPRSSTPKPQETFQTLPAAQKIIHKAIPTRLVKQSGHAEKKRKKDAGPGYESRAHAGQANRTRRKSKGSARNIIYGASARDEVAENVKGKGMICHEASFVKQASSKLEANVNMDRNVNGRDMDIASGSEQASNRQNTLARPRGRINESVCTGRAGKACRWARRIACRAAHCWTALRCWARRCEEHLARVYIVGAHVNKCRSLCTCTVVVGQKGHGKDSREDSSSGITRFR